MAKKNIVYRINPQTGEIEYPITTSAAIGMSNGSGNLDKDLINRTMEYNVSLFHPTNGIGDTNKYTLETAIAQIPSKYRTIGIKCSFIGEDGNVECWEYRGGDWDVNSFLQEGAKKFTELDNKAIKIKKIEFLNTNKLSTFPFYNKNKLSNNGGSRIENGLLSILKSDSGFFDLSDFLNLSRTRDNYYIVGKITSNQETSATCYVFFGKDNRPSFENRICLFEIVGSEAYEYNRFGIFGNTGDSYNIEFLYVIPKELYYEGISNDIVDGVIPDRNNKDFLDIKKTSNENSINIQKINDEVFSYERNSELSSNKEEAGYYVNAVNKILNQSDSYKLIFYSVNPNTNYIVDANVAGDYIGVISLWNSDEIKNSSIIEVLYNTGRPSQPTVTNKLIKTTETTKYLVLSVKTNSTYKVFSAEEYSRIDSLEERVGILTCYCWGNSLTWGAGSTNWYYAKWLNTLQSKIKFISCGVGGESLAGIAARQGSNAIYLKQDIELPADTSEIAFGQAQSPVWNFSYGYAGGLLVQGSGRDIDTVSPLTIDGIECEIRLDKSSSTYYLKRSVAGKARTLKNGSLIIPAGAKLRECHANVYWAGTNIGSFSSIEELIERIKKMIDFNGNNRYVVIGLHKTHTSNTPNDVNQINDALKNEFGARFIDELSYMIEHGIYDAVDRGYISRDYPTSEDTEAMSQGKVPPSLLYDEVHYKDVGYQLIGDLIYERFIALGYF